MRKEKFVGIERRLDSSLSESALKIEKCWHLLVRQTSVVEPEESIRTALKIIAHRGFRHLPVVKRDHEKKLLGMISAQDVIDLISACYHQSPDFISEKHIGENNLLFRLNESVSKIMSDNPVAITTEGTILDAIMLMTRNNIGALPILEGSKKVAGNMDYSEGAKTRPDGAPAGEVSHDSMVGIITLRDIVFILAAFSPFGVRVEDLMTPRVVSVREDDTIFSAVNLMSVRRVRRLPVTSSRSKDRFEGMITNKIILRLLESCLAYTHLGIAPVEALKQQVKTTMISELPLIDPREDCGTAAYLMRELGTGGFAVSDSRGLLGIITERDLVKGICEKEGISFFSDLFQSKRQTIYT